MSTAATTHHRFSDPFAMAAAVAVIIGGATVIGVAVSQSDSGSPGTTTGVTQGRHGGTAWNPGDKIGQGDFTQPRSGTDEPPLKGGHLVLGQP